MFFFLKILSIFNIHTGRREKVLKKLIVIYIQKGLTIGYTAQTLNPFNSSIEYTAQTLNFFNSYSFSNMGLTHSLYVIYNPMMRFL